MTRFPHPVWDELPQDARSATDGFPLRINSVLAMGHAPTLVRPLLELIEALHARLELSPRDRERLIMLVAHETHCPYEWAQHLPRALAVGLDDEALARIVDRGRVCPDPAERALLTAGRAYLDGLGWSESVWNTLSEHFDRRRAVEILFVLGAVRMFTLYINALELEVDPATPEMLHAWAEKSGSLR